jgi:hypothetical protein
MPDDVSRALSSETEHTVEVQQTLRFAVAGPVLLPLGNEYTAEARGSVLNTVRCVRCKHVYGYVMVRSEPGGAVSYGNNAGAEARARWVAGQALRGALAKGCDPVPCPECGTYQPNMLPQLRHTYRRELRRTGIRLLLAAGLLFALTRWVLDLEEAIVLNWVTWMAWAAGSLAGVGLIGYRWYLGSRHDPNSQPDTERRKEIGRQRVAAAKRYIARWRTEDTVQPETGNSQGIRAERSAAADRPRDDGFSEFSPLA